jgi:Tfp pilus assembly pilus retraction ATPase PilT
LYVKLFSSLNFLFKNNIFENKKEQIKELIEMSNKKQMMMFSATINKNVVGLVKK